MHFIMEKQRKIRFLSVFGEKIERKHAKNDAKTTKNHFILLKKRKKAKKSKKKKKKTYPRLRRFRRKKNALPGRPVSGPFPAQCHCRTGSGSGRVAVVSFDRGGQCGHFGTG
jgi:hypothetical protein